MKLDLKFYGEVRKIKDDSVVPEDQWMVFLAKDNAFALTLPYYLERCKELECDIEQIQAVEKTLDRLNIWRSNNSQLLKNPDAEGERLED